MAAMRVAALLLGALLAVPALAQPVPPTAAASCAAATQMAESLRPRLQPAAGETVDTVAVEVDCAAGTFTIVQHLRVHAELVVADYRERRARQEAF